MNTEAMTKILNFRYSLKIVQKYEKGKFIAKLVMVASMVFQVEVSNQMR